MTLKRKESLDRQDAANWLAAFAIALAHGGQAQVDLGGTTVRLQVPEDVQADFDVQVDGEDVVLDIALTWSAAPAAAPAEVESTPAA